MTPHLTQPSRDCPKDLLDGVAVMVNQAACAVGGLTWQDRDRWYDALEEAVGDGLEGTEIPEEVEQA